MKKNLELTTPQTPSSLVTKSAVKLSLVCNMSMAVAKAPEELETGSKFVTGSVVVSLDAVFTDRNGR